MTWSRISYLLGAICLALGACSSSTSDVQVRVVHAIPDGLTLRGSYATNEVFQNLSYLNVTPYFDISTKTESLEIRDQTTQSILFRLKLDLDAGFYTLVLAKPLELRQVIRFEDDNSQPAAGKGRLKIFQGVADLTMDLIITEPDQAANDDRVIKYPGVSFGAITTNRSLDAGSYRVVATEQDNTDNILFTTDIFSVAEGEQRTLILAPSQSSADDITSQWIVDAL